MSYHRLRNTRTALERCHHIMIIQPFRHSTAPKFDGDPPVHKKWTESGDASLTFV